MFRQYPREPIDTSLGWPVEWNSGGLIEWQQIHLAANSMLENLNRSRGVVFSGTVLLELARRGISREQAYEWVQRNAMRSFHEQKEFKSLLLADPDLMKVLTPAEVEKAFDLNDQMRNVDAIFERVFGGKADIASVDAVRVGTGSI